MNWAQIQANALSGKRLTALSDLSAVLILSLSELYRPRYRWRVDDNETTDAEWDEIEHAISQMEDEIMRGIVGMILPHVLASTANLDVLACDGASYQRVDYPELYAEIDAIYHIDADNFRVPDLRDNFVVGAGGSLNLDDSGGTAQETLSEAQMPSHSHSNLPHTHSEITALPAVAAATVGVPIPSAIPAIGVTGLTSINIGNTGGNAPHNNMPPYIALAWVIVAK